MAEPNEVKKLIKQLSNRDWRKRVSAAVALGKLGDKNAMPHLTKALSDPDRDVRFKAAEALGEMANKSDVPGLVKALSDLQCVRQDAAEALGKLGVKESAKPKLDFSKDNWPRAGEFNKHPVGMANLGGPAVDLRLSLSGPAVGNEVSLQFATLSPGEKATGTIAICPEAPGSSVPLHWKQPILISRALTRSSRAPHTLRCQVVHPSPR